jgi:tRNA modification GTPase
MDLDTIAAISTPMGEGGIGIVRVSGPDAISIADKVVVLSGRESLCDIPSHSLRLCKVQDPDTRETVDEALVSVMRSPRSFTREDIVEINCHGGPVPLMATLNALLSWGARLAEPGEFSKRAFLNGRIDLAQAEAIIDVIRSHTDKGLATAIDNLEGSLSVEIRQIREALSGLIARIEVNIDFPGEDPEADISGEELKEIIMGVQVSIEKLLAGANRGKIFRDGIKLMIAGRPNVGKSSLLNALLREKRAIVTDIPGTTRDVIEEMLNLEGIPVRIMDTAGIRPTGDTVEKIGVERAEHLLKEADIVLIVMDASQGITDEDKAVNNKTGDKKSLVIVNKCDLVEKVDLEKWNQETGRDSVAVSAKTGQGLEVLQDKILDLIHQGVGAPEGPTVTRLRHEEALKQALYHVKEAVNAYSQGVPEDILAIDLREAWTTLGEITGETASEEIVDRIFADFCIGK